MKYLLDTHALWHYASDGDGLSTRAFECLDNSVVEDLVVLDISLYELARHMAIGRVEVESPLHALATIEGSFPILHSDATVAWKSAQLDWPKRRGNGQHLDPADRAIVAAAMIHGLIIVTADKEIHHYAGKAHVQVLW